MRVKMMIKAMMDPANLQILDVGSPFDFANQGMLYLPKDLPEPGRDGPSQGDVN